MKPPAVIAGWLALVLAICATGCATSGNTPSTADTERALAPLFCVSPEECTLFWKRAQVWVATRGHYRIQIANDTVISTYTVYPEVWFGFNVVKEPLGAGRELIRIDAACANRFGCISHPYTPIAAFKRYVATGTE